MARKRRGKTKSRKKRYSSSESESSESETSSSDFSESESESDISSISSDSDSSEDSSSESDSADNSDFDETEFPGESKRKTEEEVRELIRDAKVMKYENAIIDQAGIDNYESMRNCDERTLKRLGMGYSDRERLLKAFRNHIEGIIDKNRQKWERKQELKRDIKKKKSGKKSSKSKSRSKSKSSRSKRKPTKKKGSSKTKSRSKQKIDPDEALRKIDTSWSGKKQAWADYKQHEARVAELVEFYDEIGKKRANGEEHARRLLVSYPGGIHKLVIALDKKYHHIPYGWESLLDEAQRLQEYSNSNSD